MHENSAYAYNMSMTFFRRRKFFQGGEALPLVADMAIRWLGMQTSHCRLDWYMDVYSKRLLVRFLLDILKFSLVGLDNSAWEFDWCWERILDKRCLDQWCSRDRNLRDRAQISRRDRDFVIKAETEIKTKTWKFETETRDLTFLWW